MPENITDMDIANQRSFLKLNPKQLELSFDKVATSSGSKSVAIKKNKEDKEIDELVVGTKKINLIAQDTDHSVTNLQPTNFVINTIAYVPEREFDDDSSDEEDDRTFSDESFSFNSKNHSSIPFTTIPPKYARKKAS